MFPLSQKFSGVARAGDPCPGKAKMSNTVLSINVSHTGFRLKHPFLNTQYLSHFIYVICPQTVLSRMLFSYGVTMGGGAQLSGKIHIFIAHALQASTELSRFYTFRSICSSSEH